MPGPPPKRSDQRRRKNKTDPTEKAVSFRQSGEDKVRELVATHKKPELVAAALAAGIEVEKGWTKADLAWALIANNADPEWHPVARDWYESLALSGQSAFYEESDWAVARLIAESMSRDLKPQIVGHTDDGTPIAFSRPINGASLRAYLSGFASLLATEGDRRRARLELQKPGDQEAGEDGADVSEIDEWRDRLRSSN